MGKDAAARPRELSHWELTAFTRALELSLPEHARVKGRCWASTSATQIYALSVWSDVAGTPLLCSWLAERSGDVYHLAARPAREDEIAELLRVLGQLDALPASTPFAIAEAQYDCRNRTYQLCFTSLKAMVEGVRYRRWIFRRHLDGRPLSVGYLCETKRCNALETLPGGAVLRGDPWAR